MKMYWYYDIDEENKVYKSLFLETKRSIYSILKMKVK